MAKYAPFFDLREKAEILVMIMIIVVGTPICVALGTSAAQADFKTLNPDETPAAIQQLMHEKKAAQ
jgi:hypothetical protein